MAAIAFAASGPTLDVVGNAWRELEIASWVVWSLFVFAFGASLGSFMNVVAWRLPRGGSIVSPPSRCPTCAGRLSWRENLPVLGWLLLRGRCRFCGERIGVQYLLVELLLGGLFVAAFVVCYLPGAGDWWTLGTGDWWTRRQLAGSWPGFLVILSLFSLLVPITLIDARTFLIPLSLTLWIV
ncbi:MAG: prepilin peptidase, partial [Planctomycetota bacterium]